ncbi:hypothetical protein PUN28_015114 [Cardiocondyla obscurior]|uniref:Uncharacterized protein n=1 Tax=Cardiocondyla obscurior TaxID=286306 RepID=A0AAW2F0G3_9HYME
MHRRIRACRARVRKIKKKRGGPGNIRDGTRRAGREREKEIGRERASRRDARRNRREIGCCEEPDEDKTPMGSLWLLCRVRATRRIDKCTLITIDRNGPVSSASPRPRAGVHDLRARAVSNFTCVPRNAGPRRA